MSPSFFCGSFDNQLMKDFYRKNNVYCMYCTACMSLYCMCTACFAASLLIGRSREIFFWLLLFKPKWGLHLPFSDGFSTNRNDVCAKFIGKR